MNKLIEFLKSPLKIFVFLANRGINFFDDETYLKIRYRATFHKKLNLKEPKTFDEKLQWLKLNDRKDFYTTLVDKYEVKNYISKIIGEEYVIPTIGIYDTFDEINFDELPNQFVIKCTHDSGGLVIVKNKERLDIKKTRKKINRSLKRNYYFPGREWPYKNVKPRIIVEEYKEDKKYNELRDYKLYAFNGKCDYVMLCLDRFNGGTKFIYFDKNWNMKKEFSYDGIKYGDTITVDKPKNLKNMFEFAKILSKNIPFLRVDFYEVDGKLYFGELTFFPSSGFDNTRTIECQKYLDKMLIINNMEKRK